MRGVNLHSTVDGPSGGPSTIYNAMDGPGGPSILLWMAQGDQVFCYGWSGGTKYSTMDGPGDQVFHYGWSRGTTLGRGGRKPLVYFLITVWVSPCMVFSKWLVHQIPLTHSSPSLYLLLHAPVDLPDGNEVSQGFLLLHL